MVRQLSRKLAEKQPAKVAPHDPEGKLKQPGIKILHSPDFDFRTIVYSLADALAEVRKWSDSHRRTFPVFLLLELKSESFSRVISTDFPKSDPRFKDYAVNFGKNVFVRPNSASAPHASKVKQIEP